MPKPVVPEKVSEIDEALEASGKIQSAQMSKRL